jgi:hypothetical protein
MEDDRPSLRPPLYAPRVTSARRRGREPLRSDRPFRALAEPARDRDRLVAQDQRRGFEQRFVHGAADFGLDDLDSQVSLLAADQPRNPVPASRSALVGVHGR